MGINIRNYMSSLAHPTRWRHRHYNGDGQLLWASGLGELGDEGIYRATPAEVEAINQQKWQLNTVTNEGEKWILYAAFHDNAEPNGGTFTSFALQLSENASLAETTDYAGRSELAGGASGYAAINIARSSSGWTTPTGDTPSSITTPTSGTHQFSATGTWDAVYAAMIVTVGQTTNTLIAWDNLSATRNLVNGDTLDIDFDITAEAV